MEDLLAGNSASPLSNHTSGGVTEALSSFVEALEGEALRPEYNTFWLASQLPDWLRFLIRKVVDRRRSFLLGNLSKYKLLGWAYAVED